MTNTQPIEKPLYRKDGAIDVVNIWETIQGEGPFAGMPATFVRLAGCNLQCPACDTDYTTGRGHITAHAVAIRVLSCNYKLVVFTGGEPFRQDLSHVIREIQTEDKHKLVQIETNGTVPPRGFRKNSYDGSPSVTIVCSPKTPKISPVLASMVDAYKYVIDADHVDPKDGLPTASLGMPAAPFRPPQSFSRDRIYVQPMDPGPGKVGTKDRHIEAAVESCMKHGYRLCLQTHKIAGLS